MFIVYCFEILNKTLNYLKIFPTHAIAEEYKIYIKKFLSNINYNDNYIVFVLDYSIMNFTIEYPVFASNFQSAQLFTKDINIRYVNTNMIETSMKKYIETKMDTPIPTISIQYLESPNTWINLKKIIIDECFILTNRALTFNED